jgi:hypothetical protein
MDSPNLRIGRSVLIIMGRLWFGREDVDFWDVLPLDWASEGAFGEEALAIWDAMEEEFQRDKMISHQKSKGKSELLNLHSSYQLWRR